MGTYIPFTEEQREQARMTDLTAFLRQCGEEIKRSGSENMWLDHGQKVTIRGNLWFHQYEQVGGDAVDFVCRFYGLDYREAVLTLVYTGVGTIREPVEPFPKKPLQIPAVYENIPYPSPLFLKRYSYCKGQGQKSQLPTVNCVAPQIPIFRSAHWYRNMAARLRGIHRRLKYRQIWP